MKIVLIGSGNVATHLGQALYQAGHRVIQVYSRTLKNAEYLAAKLGAEAIDQIDEVNKGADLLILSVKDDALSMMIESLPTELNGIIVHTAGSVPMSVLSRFKRHGVFYPFQTFSKEAEVDFENLPILYEAVSDQVKDELERLAGQLSKFRMEASSEQRGKLHIAAVFACNFVNHMYALADDLLKKNDLPFELLQPLISETAAKVQVHQPANTQTGPAVRNDHMIVKKHLALLRDEPVLEQLYELLSQSIMKKHG